MAGLADQVHACTSVSVFLMCALYIVFNERQVTIVMTRSYILFICFKNNCHLLCPDQIFWSDFQSNTSAMQVKKTKTTEQQQKKTCSSFPFGFFVIIETMNRSMGHY